MSNSMSTGAAQPAGFADPAILERGYRKATWRLIPFIFICYLFNYLDRVNVGFAKLEMLDALKPGATVSSLPTAIPGVAVLFFLSDGLQQVRWRPSIIKAPGFDNPATVGWLSGLPMSQPLPAAFLGSTDVALYILSTVLLVMTVPARLVNR